MKKPLMIMFMGIPGSGKSTLAKHIHIDNENIYIEQDEVHENGPIIHSSDDLREELFGNVNDQSNNTELFAELHKRIKSDLRNGKDVIYDATNINKKLRIAFLNELNCIECRKVCIAVMTPFKVCLTNNIARDRKVPEKIIRKMYMNWQPPHFNEGFDAINFAFQCYKNDNNADYSIGKLFEVMDKFDQENEHHKLTLGAHCMKAYQYCLKTYPKNKNLRIAALLHDIGKIDTKVRKNAKGLDDGNCHYYQHHCVGAYMAMFYLAQSNLSIIDQVDIVNMIYYHMNPYGSWKQSEKACERDRRQIGENLFRDVIALHEADLAAH